MNFCLCGESENFSLAERLKATEDFNLPERLKARMNLNFMNEGD